MEILKPTEPQEGLGRVYQPNPGSRRYPLEAALPRSALRAGAWKTKRWRLGTGQTFRDQGNTSHCVRYGCTHVLIMQAIVRGNAFDLTTELYRWAQQNDYWPGEEPTYYGTSVDAGLQYLLKMAGVISEYRWASSMDELLGRLSIPAAEGGGPVIVGTDWYTGMDDLDGDGHWSPTGNWRGGHCYILTGHWQPTSRREGRIWCGNSHSGNYVGWMTYDEAEWILFAQNGEAAAVTELPVRR